MNKLKLFTTIYIIFIYSCNIDIANKNMYNSVKQYTSNLNPVKKHVFHRNSRWSKSVLSKSMLFILLLSKTYMTSAQPYFVNSYEGIDIDEAPAGVSIASIENDTGIVGLDISNGALLYFDSFDGKLNGRALQLNFEALPEHIVSTINDSIMFLSRGPQVSSLLCKINNERNIQWCSSLLGHRPSYLIESIDKSSFYFSGINAANNDLFHISNIKQDGTFDFINTYQNTIGRFNFEEIITNKKNIFVVCDLTPYNIGGLFISILKFRIDGILTKAVLLNITDSTSDNSFSIKETINNSLIIGGRLEISTGKLPLIFDIDSNLTTINWAKIINETRSGGIISLDLFKTGIIALSLMSNSIIHKLDYDGNSIKDTQFNDIVLRNIKNIQEDLYGIGRIDNSKLGLIKLNSDLSGVNCTVNINSTFIDITPQIQIIDITDKIMQINRTVQTHFINETIIPKNYTRKIECAPTELTLEHTFNLSLEPTSFPTDLSPPLPTIFFTNDPSINPTNIPSLSPINIENTAFMNIQDDSNSYYSIAIIIGGGLIIFCGIVLLVLFLKYLHRRRTRMPYVSIMISSNELA